MATVTGSPYAITSATLKLGTDTFEKMIGSADCTPSYQNATFDTISGESRAVGDTAAWVLNIMYAQDWVGASSLANYLAANDGTIKAFEYVTNSGTGKKVAGNVLIRAGVVGGAGRQTATATVALPIDGVPTLTTVP